MDKRLLTLIPRLVNSVSLLIMAIVGAFLIGSVYGWKVGLGAFFLSAAASDRTHLFIK